MTQQRWTAEELADLNETISAAQEAGNKELADYWTGIRDGDTPTTDWEDLRVDLYAEHGIDVGTSAA